MEQQPAIDLSKEQQASRARPRYPYSATARVFFGGMDLLTGRQTTLAKVKLVEILATVPYRAWERHERALARRSRANPRLARKADAVASWGREAAANEQRHLFVVEEKMREDSVKEPWYLTAPLPSLMAGSYALLEWVLARVAIHGAILFNAEFEDHAEHTYAQFVQEHPEFEDQPAEGPAVREYDASARTWADVFRRVGLDERDHMNNSFVFAGRPLDVVEYDGMPPLPSA